jgi:hypothetical protein
MRSIASAVLALITLALPAEAQTPLACGQPVAGTIGFIGEQDLFTFSGQQGDIVSVAILTTGQVDSGFTASADITRPNGARLQSVLLGNIGPLPESGTYTMAVHDHVVFNKRGSYTVILNWIFPLARQCNAAAISCGPPTLGSIAFAGEQDLYRFTAQTGDIVSFVITTTSRADASFTASGTLYRPDGSRQADVLVGNLGPLPIAGTYTLSIHDHVIYRQRGTYAVTLTWIQGQCPSVLSPPGEPTNLTASVTGSSVTLNWSAPTSGGAVASYVVEAGVTPGSSNVTVVDTGSTATSLTATSVPTGAYFVRVKGKNAAGTSGPSNEVAVLVGGPGPCTSPPGAVTGLSAAVSGQTVTLTWTAPSGSVTTYIVEAGSFSGGTNIAQFPTGNANTTLTAVAGSGTYFVRVKASNVCGTGPSSNEVIISVP